MENTNVSRKKSAFIALQLPFFLFFSLFFCKAQAQEYYEAGKLRLKLTEEMATTFESSPLQKTSSGAIKVGSTELNTLHSKYNATKYKRVFPYAGKYEKKHRKYGLHLWYEIEMGTNQDVIEAVQGYNNTSGVQLAEPIYKTESFENIENQPENLMSSSKASSNDTFFNLQWGAENTGQSGGTAGADISLLEAWDIQTGSTDVVVAILDSGVDFDHQDLAANMWTNTDEIPGNGIDDDDNGYVDDVYGYNFADDTGAIFVGDHGTHVAGIVAAVSNNSTGIAGIAGGNGSGDGVRLMSCAVYGDGSANGFSTGFVYAADNGAIIAQSSWGYGSGFYPEFVKEAIAYFIAEAGYDENGNAIGPMQGGLAVFSAGNQATFSPQYPAADPAVMAIGSTDDNDDPSVFSNRGDWVEVSAPGTAIFSTFPDNTYSYWSGTSFSCPQVSGVAALLVSEFAGNITPDEVRSKIVDSADPLEVTYLGSGRLNAFAALQGDINVNTPPIALLTATPISGDAPLEVSFDASGSTDADGDTLSYSIDYGDGTSGSSAVSTHTYVAGEYTATVTVTDGNGGSDTASVLITVDEVDVNTPPVADLVVTPISGNEPLEVSFDASGSTDADGDALSYFIDYGDGTTGTAAISTHTYLAGNYTVTLMVTDGNGGSDSVMVSISVEGDTNTLPVADLVVTPISGDAPLEVSFDASGSTDADGDALSYSIDYGDGTTGTEAISTHTYLAGEYTVTLMVTDGKGGSDIASQVITVSSVGDNDCTFNTPIETGLSSTGYMPYKNIHVLGTGGPDLSNVTDFTINWDLANNGLYQFSMLTNNGRPSWWNNLLSKVTHTFGSAQPAVTISGSGFTGLDGSYYAAKDGDNFVLVSIDADFTIYFSNNSVPPSCDNSKSQELAKASLEVKPFSLPNPVKSKLTLFNLGEVSQITITDMLGKTILTEENPLETQAINLEGYKSGLYVISYYRTNKGTVRSTFIKE
ncbi:PKD domain-containing protein [Aquimarina pacifica]|uniref:PKD domain-containing protein n=1 Tax=Aquimarina pacifica TaxID=1296415 RepID=UPI00046E8E45|nr:PKD domain-containing protein [Aquimarina pacifica]